MAKGKYQRWLEPDGLTLLEGWARDGLTDEQIAGKCGCSCSTLYDWKGKYPEISEALKKGKEVVDYEVENALLAAALEGNTTAQIFWLKNRRADKWRDKPEPVKQEEKDNNLFAQLEESLNDLRTVQPETAVDAAVVETEGTEKL